MVLSNRVKAMENELQDKTKVDRGLLNAWFIEVQRTKVNQSIDFYWKILFRNVNVFFQEEAEKYRKRRDATMDYDKQLQLAVQEIEQVNSVSVFLFCFSSSSNLISYVLLYVKLKNMLVINLMKHQLNWPIYSSVLIILKN